MIPLALEWTPNVAGGELAVAVVVLVACLALVAGLTYLLEEIRHDPNRRSRK